MAQTTIERIAAAKKPHRCSWCGDRIEIGQPYSRWRYFDGYDARTTKMHPECLEALDEAQDAEGSYFEWMEGENPRGCNCGHDAGCKRCAEKVSLYHGDIHTIPVDDLREHIGSMECFCQPRRDTEESKIIIHNAIDQREEYENGRKLS